MKAFIFFSAFVFVFAVSLKSVHADEANCLISNQAPVSVQFNEIAFDLANYKNKALAPDFIIVDDWQPGKSRVSQDSDGQVIYHLTPSQAEAFLNQIAANTSLQIGLSGNFAEDKKPFRSGGYTVGASYQVAVLRKDTKHPVELSAQVTFVDFGKQPNGIRNINRTLNLDAQLKAQVWKKLSAFFAAGLTDSDFGYNGDSPGEPGYGYNAKNRISGFNAGFGAEYRLTNRIAIFVKRTQYHFHQIDRPNFDPREHYEFNGNTSAGFDLKFQ